MKKILQAILSFFGLGKKKPPVILPKPPEENPPVINPPVPTSKSVLDDRPIGMIMIAEWIEPYIDDDRRWKLLGKYQFSKEALMEHGRECIRHMTSVDAQAMILWNIEGEQYWKPVSYIGDPRIFIPEIAPYLDEFFSLFHGFRTGLCLRPDIYYDMVHYVTSDPVADILAKAKYCKDRWGSTVFYIDSNKAAQPYTDNTMGHGGPMPAEVFAELKKQMPDCEFIPEHHTAEYYKNVPVFTKGAYIIPGAKVVGQVAGDTDLTEFVQAGNIPLFEAWWKSDILNRIIEAYQKKKS